MKRWEIKYWIGLTWQNQWIEKKGELQICNAIRNYISNDKIIALFSRYKGNYIKYFRDPKPQARIHSFQRIFLLGNSKIGCEFPQWLTSVSKWTSIDGGRTLTLYTNGPPTTTTSNYPSASFRSSIRGKKHHRMRYKDLRKSEKHFRCEKCFDFIRGVGDRTWDAEKVNDFASIRWTHGKRWIFQRKNFTLAFLDSIFCSS